MKKKLLLSILVLLMAFSLAGCDKKEEKDSKYIEKKEETNQGNNELDNNVEKPEMVENLLNNCNNCVYAYFTDKKSIGSVLDNYTKDYNTLKNTNGEQRKSFFGFLLEGNKISVSFVCAIKDNKSFCVEGLGSVSKFKSNVTLLNEIYSAGQCRYVSNGRSYICNDGQISAEVKADGYVSIKYDSNCTIFGNGQIYCK